MLVAQQQQQRLQAASQGKFCARSRSLYVDGMFVFVVLTDVDAGESGQSAGESMFALTSWPVYSAM